MLRSVLLALSLPLATSASLPNFPSPEAAVVKIDCGRWMGSGFRINDSTIVSVNHVVKSGTCKIGGNLIQIRHSSTSADFATLAGTPGPFLDVDCRGFIAGRKYLAIGYARDEAFETTIELTATGRTDHGQALLLGMFTMIPGQSGGPVIDKETHMVVGTVNMYNFEDGASYSVPLSTTSVCRNV